MRAEGTGSAVQRLRRGVLGRAGKAYRRWAMRHHDDTVDGAVDAARDVIRSRRYCVLVTTDESGAPVARMMQAWHPDGDWVIRFGTDPNSRKARDIVRTGRCLIVYPDERGGRNLSIDCRASLVTDLTAKRRWFMPAWTAFWPAGSESAGFVVVECVAESMELWDGRAVVAPEPFGRRSRHLVRTDIGWERADDVVRRGA
ncbi:pyridoxamine 5'-phosphate oxidase family protein [Microlunatus sp. Y2014]|uniref:pyridoxamine 5'-phosphate oxidase family protein n=1 Tax=Microlunatus sp. Y2014 TaxID=3418488 RepID=UPI003DA780AB